MSAAELIEQVCDEIKEMLIEKNRKYGNSALEPVRIFSKSDTMEQINVRIDDKLSRARNAQDDDDEDVESDLIGYLILKKVHRLMDDDLPDPEENWAATINIFAKQDEKRRESMARHPSAISIRKDGCAICDELGA